MSSPTSRSLELMRERGYLIAVVEKWLPWAKKRQDLFGLWDLIAVKDGETCAVQTTSASNVSARIKKITDHENLARCRKAGWKLLVHGWVKKKGRWQVKEIDVS